MPCIKAQKAVLGRAATIMCLREGATPPRGFLQAAQGVKRDCRLQNTRLRQYTRIQAEALEFAVVASHSWRHRRFIAPQYIQV